MRSTLDKLKGVKADLVRGNEGWRDWDFKDLLKELKKWSEINPVEENMPERIPGKGISNSKQTTPTRVFKTHSQQEPRTRNQQGVLTHLQLACITGVTFLRISGERGQARGEREV